MPEPKRVRAEAALDDVSDHLGVVLRRADELLVQWSAFGASVRGQVEREAASIGDAVAGAVETAVSRATAGGIDRAMTEQLGSRLTALASEITRLEARTRAAARAVADERTGDRRLLWIVIGGILVANALLIAILLRRPVVVHAPAEPTKVEVAPPAGGAASEVPATAGSAAPEADAPSELPAPAQENAPRPEPASLVPVRPVGAAASGTVQGGGPTQVLGASAPGVRAATSPRLPPRMPPQKK